MGRVLFCGWLSLSLEVILFEANIPTLNNNQAYSFLSQCRIMYLTVSMMKLLLNSTGYGQGFRAKCTL